jgi:hypothetical protein
MLVLTEQHDREDRGKVSSDARAVLHGAAGPTTVPRVRQFFRGQLNRFVASFVALASTVLLGFLLRHWSASNPELSPAPQRQLATQQNSPVASTAWPTQQVSAPVVSGREGTPLPEDDAPHTTWVPLVMDAEGGRQTVAVPVRTRLGAIGRQPGPGEVAHTTVSGNWLSAGEPVPAGHQLRIERRWVEWLTLDGQRVLVPVEEFSVIPADLASFQ